MAGAAFLAGAAAPFLAGAALAVDFEAEPDVLLDADDFEPVLAVLPEEEDDFEPELEDLPAVDLLAPPVDLLVVDLLAPPLLALLVVDLPALDLAAEPEDLPAVAFEPEDLLAVAFDAEPVDLLPEVFDAEPEDLAAPEPAAGFAEDLPAAALVVVFDELLAEDDFDAELEPEDLLDDAALVGAAFLFEDEAAFVGAAFLFAAGAAFVIAVFLFVVVDFVELSVDFLVAIFFSLKCFRTNFTKTGLKQTYERIFTRLVSMCQDIF